MNIIPVTITLTFANGCQVSGPAELDLDDYFPDQQQEILAWRARGYDDQVPVCIVDSEWLGECQTTIMWEALRDYNFKDDTTER